MCMSGKWKEEEVERGSKQLPVHAFRNIKSIMRILGHCIFGGVVHPP